jgi:arsenate reductase-like glutaredoxin family protein
MSEIEAIDILSKNGNLVKRPFAISGACVLVGFKEPIWERFLLVKTHDSENL